METIRRQTLSSAESGSTEPSVAPADTGPGWAGPATRVELAAQVRQAVAAGRLAEPSGRATVRRLAATWSLAALCTIAGIAAASLPVWIVVWVVNAWVFAGNAAILHEGVHGHLFASKRANKVLGTLAPATIFVNTATYRAYHLEHHARTAIDGDPEGTPLNFGRRWHYLALMSVASFAIMLENLVYTALTVVGRPPKWIRSKSQVRAIRLNAVLWSGMVALAVTGLLLDPSLTLEVWLIPAGLAIYALLPFLLLPEHYGATGDGDLLDNTRTVRSNRLLRWFFWNTNYHAAHHLVPAVPFDRLPAIDRLLDGGGLRPEWRVKSYMAFHLGTLRRLAFNRERAVSD